MLLDAGADTATVDNEGLTPFHFAALNMNSLPLLLLLERGVDIEAKDNVGRTPLHYAAQYSEFPSTLLVLLDTGADTTAVDNEGRTPLDVAREFGNATAIAVLEEAGTPID